MKNIIQPIVVLLLAAAVAGAYAYMIRDINLNVARASEAASGVETLSARDATARSMEFLLEETADESAALLTLVIRDADVAGPIAIIEDAARLAKVKVSISSIAITAPDGWVRHQGIEVSFSATASLAALARFASILESLPVGSRLERSSFEASKDSWFGTFRVLFVKEKL
jgi:hypothetical protein